MQFKPITAIIVLLIVVASLLVSGCMVDFPIAPVPKPPSTATSMVATHDAFLENYLTAYKNKLDSDTKFNVKAWEVTWKNSTSAQLQYAYTNKTTNVTWAYDDTVIVFPTSQDATYCLNAINKTEYSLASTQYISGGAYQNVTGHAPEIYINYLWNEGNPANISEYKVTRLNSWIISFG